MHVRCPSCDHKFWVAKRKLRDRCEKFRQYVMETGGDVVFSTILREDEFVKSLAAASQIRGFIYNQLKSMEAAGLLTKITRGAYMKSADWKPQ